MVINTALAKDYPQLLEIWEASVKATHNFLTEQVIQALKPLIVNDYFPTISLIYHCNTLNHITGFAGVNKNKLEMLFVHSTYKRQGIGKILLAYAIKYFQVNKLDVNEQNPEAISFYLSQGFHVIGKSEQDGQGNSYPLLHMALHSTIT